MICFMPQTTSLSLYLSHAINGCNMEIFLYNPTLHILHIYMHICMHICMHMYISICNVGFQRNSIIFTVKYTSSVPYRYCRSTKSFQLIWEEGTKSTQVLLETFSVISPCTCSVINFATFAIFLYVPSSTPLS